MPSHVLSIIIPCFNCESTLAEAVHSIYLQDLGVSFEVVMVDDASTDDTFHVIEKLLTKHANIRVISHEENRGGGAARNTGIRMAKGDLIYCLDSDNFLDQVSLGRMITFLDEMKCDGVVFHERKFLLGGTRGVSTSFINSVTERPLELSDLFNSTSTMLDNFLFTKESYARAGGYPEHHGFDTQSFEMRYLAAGNAPRVCPGTVFYHRQFDKKGKSYFERVYERGEYSKNIYLSLEDILFLFSSAIRERILAYPIFENTSLYRNNLMSDVKKWYQEDSNRFFVNQYKQLQVTNGEKTAFSDVRNSKKTGDIFFCAIYHYKHQEYGLALEKCEQLIQKGEGTTLVFYTLLRSLLGLSGKVEHARIEQVFPSLVESLSLKPQANDLRKSLPSLVLGKINRTLRRKTS